MKRKTIILSLIALLIISVATWYFTRDVQYCEVAYSTNPHTEKLVVSCDETHCKKTCYLSFRKKGSEEPWQNPSDSHKFDTTAYEYRCKCK